MQSGQAANIVSRLLFYTLRKSLGGGMGRLAHGEKVPLGVLSTESPSNFQHVW